MSFMKPVLYKGDVIVADTAFGTEVIEGDLFSASELARLEKHNDDETLDIVRPYLESNVLFDVAVLRGRWIAYLSAPGYMDRTAPSQFVTKGEAEAFLREEQGEGDES
jgi:hypothetical protein